MKRLYAAFMLVFIAVLGFHCQREVSNIDIPGMAGDNDINSASPITATLQGNVLDETGAPAIGVNIKVGTKTATTDARGYFRIVNAGLDKNASLVIAEKTGYLKSFRTFRATSGVNQVLIKLIPRKIAGTVNAAAGGSVSLANGSKVTLPANGIVKASDGAAYTETVNVYASYIDPTSTDINQIVPGSFMADDKDKKRVTLSSYGMVAVELESSAGEKLQIAPGSKATLITAIPNTLQASAPATIALWYVDEATGLWKEEGSAVKNGNNYEGDVKHFTYWNCDISVPTVSLKATFKTQDGLPLVNTEVLIRPVATNYYGYAHGFTDSLGQINGLVPANMPLMLQVMAYGGCSSPIYTQSIGPYTEATDLGVITISATLPSVVTIKGKLVNCSNVPVTDGHAIIYYDYWVRNVDVNSNGEFTAIFTTCNSSPVFKITGVDRAAQQQGMIMNVTVSGSLTDLGTITACGTSTLQFINYELDGVNQTIPGTDSLMGYNIGVQVPGTYSNTSWITGQSSQSKRLFIEFDNNAVAGTYPAKHLQVNDFERTALIAPFDVTVTRFPASAGDYFEGNFSGQFRDSSDLAPLHTINATFRARRTW